MEYINEYLEKELGFRPLGEITFEEPLTEDGCFIGVDDREPSMKVSWMDYAFFLENKIKKLNKIEEKFNKHKILSSVLPTEKGIKEEFKLIISDWLITDLKNYLSVVDDVNGTKKIQIDNKIFKDLDKILK